MAQRFVLSPWTPSSHRHLSVAVVKCPDCPHRFTAEAELADGLRGLLDPDAAIDELLAHAHRADSPHPTLLGEPVPARRGV